MGDVRILNRVARLLCRSPAAALGAFGLLVATHAVCAAPAVADESRDVSDLMVVDCLLPGQVRQLGKARYLAARKAVRTTAADCEIRGGEFVAHDRATRASSLKVWLPLAEEGDPEAQNLVGEIYERGMGLAPDYGAAAAWYLKAAERGSTRAAVNLGALFEQGLGFEQDKALAAYWYRRASGIEELIPLPAPAEPADKAPAILIIEPPLKMRSGAYLLPDLRYREGSFPLVGQVMTGRAVSQVWVADKQAQLVAGSLFRSQVGSLQGRETLDINVTYQDGGRETLRIQLGPQASSAEDPGPRPEDLLPATVNPGPPSGRSYALIIGNNRYTKLENLDTAVRDAMTVADVLRDSYGFEVTLIQDATRYDALSAINQLRYRLKEDDQLLVYYAGHGELDRINDRGHWLPVDAEPDSMANWISNVTITDLLNTIPARQLMVVADSCYSGTMSRSAVGVIDNAVDEATRTRLLRSLAATRTRTVLTSGGVAPVMDGGGDGHSVFARVLLDVLRSNRGALTGFELYRAVSGLVASEAATFGVEQMPEYAPLKFAGHEAGDFVLVRQ